MHPANRRRLDPNDYPAPLKLDIGAGAEKRGEEYTSVDAYVPADVAATMWDIPFPDGTVHTIWCCHALEHAACGDIHKTLKEWLRLLRPGGRAYVLVPNFDYVAKYWLCGPDRRWAEAMVFGQQTNPGEFHKAAFSQASLRGDLEAAGFEVQRVEIRNTHNQETLMAVAVKPWPKKETAGA